MFVWNKYSCCCFRHPCVLIRHKLPTTKNIRNRNINLSFEKNISFQKCPKITVKFTQNRLTVVNEISREIKRCLKHDRDIGRKAVLSDVKTAFTRTPALRETRNTSKHNILPRAFSTRQGKGPGKEVDRNSGSSK